LEEQFVGPQLSSVGPYSIHTLPPQLEIGVDVEGASGPIDALNKGKPVLDRYKSGDNVLRTQVKTLPFTVTTPWDTTTGTPASKDPWDSSNTFRVSQPLPPSYKMPEDVAIPIERSDVTLSKRLADAGAVHFFTGPCDEANVKLQSQPFLETLRRHRWNTQSFAVICGKSNKHLAIVYKKYNANSPPPPQADD
jgi:hypothetical protein